MKNRNVRQTAIRALGITCVVSVACAFSPDPTVVRDEPQPFRTVLEAFGVENLTDYRFNPKPICPVESESQRCAEHSVEERQAVGEIFRNFSPKPEREFRMSPMRDSGGVVLVHLYLIIDPIEPGYGAIEEYQFVLDRSRTKVLRQQRLTNDLFVSTKK